MDAGLVPIWITTGFSAVGVIYAIVRNGSRAKKQDEALKVMLKAKINEMKDQLEDPDTGLQAIKKSVDGQRVHCAEVSTQLATKVETNKREIDRLRDNK